jgi:Flp pilus assembly protein TadD
MEKKILQHIVRGGLAALLVCSAAAAMADDRGVCGAVPPKSATVPSCTRIIASPRTSAHDRAVALGFRADAYRAQGDTASAIADCTEALTLLPDYLPALNVRGMAFLKAGDNVHAIADFNAALTLAPQDAAALYGRGLAKAKSGDDAGANADIDAAKKLDPAIATKF